MSVEAGDLLIGFREDGFRLAGLTAAQECFELAFGENWHDESIEIGDQLHKLGDLALRPPTVYTETITDMNTGRDVINAPKVQVKEKVDINDDGIPVLLGKALGETGLGADVVDPFEPSPVTILAQTLRPGNTSDEEAYRMWCMGHGMIIITPESDADEAVRIAEEHNIDAKIVGYVTSQPGVRIRSRGLHNPGKMLSFEA